MKPYIHAKNSAKKFGGYPEDYLDIHNFMDSSKAHLADHRHRAIFHSSFGCFIVERVFGTIRVNSDNTSYSTRDIAEQHCLEDLGTIPSVQDWLQNLPVAPWMGGNGKPGALMAKPEMPGESMVLDGAGASKPFSLDTVSELENRIKEATEAATTPFKQTILAKLQALLEANPDKPGVYWKQYTPYFNDGDACVFGMHGLYWVNPNDSCDEICPLPDDLDKYFGYRSEADRLFLAAFDDHAKVVLMRGENDFTVNKCDHD